MVNMIRDILVGMSAIVVAVVAVIGLGTWRRELRGKAIFEASKKMMGLVYKVIDDYQWATNRFTYSTESHDRPCEPNESDAVKQVINQWYARNKRMQPLREDYNELAEASREVRTILGQEAAKIIDEALVIIKNEIEDLASAVSDFFEISEKEAGSGIPLNDQTFKKEMQHIVFQSPNSDHIKRLNSIVTNLDKELAPYLRSVSNGIRRPLPILKDYRFWSQVGICSGLTILFFGIQYQIVQPGFGWFNIISGLIITALGFGAGFNTSGKD